MNERLASVVTLSLVCVVFSLGGCATSIDGVGEPAGPKTDAALDAKDATAAKDTTSPPVDTGTTSVDTATADDSGSSDDTGDFPDFGPVADTGTTSPSDGGLAVSCTKDDDCTSSGIFNCCSAPKCGIKLGTLCLAF